MKIKRDPRKGPTEAEFQNQVIDYAHLRGFRVAHFRSVCVKHKNERKTWQTPVAADGAGFFDLCMMHPATGKLVFAELKVGRNKLSARQQEWFDAAYKCQLNYDTVYVELWTPADWNRIEEVLR